MTEPLERLKAALADRYRIERELGAGGMATVYLAVDLKHERKVAVKVFHPELAALVGAERFLAEIRTTANLQHPHILPLHDSGQADGLLFYVMPYIEGETLRARLEREGQLSVEEAVRIAREVASALDYAHRHGVIHRDIKPENILLHEGQALVADFGIALAVSTAGGPRMTQTGMSLGTPEYMSPEQALGERTITAKSDVYALGCVLYEMLTGEPPFTGATVQAIVAKVMAERPTPPSVVRDTVPPHVEAAVLKALVKLPADRWATAADFANGVEGKGAVTTIAGAATPRSAGRRSWLVPTLVGGAALGGLLLGRGLPWSEKSDQPRPAELSRRFSLVLPDSLPLVFVGEATLGVEFRALDLSRDGRMLAYIAETSHGTGLVVANLTDRSYRLLEGTEGAFSPSFSPDGRLIAFVAGTELRWVSVAGGDPVRMAAVREPYGATWIDSNRVFVAARQGNLPILVDLSTGRFDTLPDGPSRAGMPTPSGDGILYSSGNQLWYYDLGDRTRWALTSRGRVLADSATPGDILYGFGPRLLPSGLLAYVQPGGALVVVPVDGTTMRPMGATTRIEFSIRYGSRASAQFASSVDGLLVAAMTPSAGQTTFEVVTPAGKTEGLGLPADDYGTFEISPDGTRLAALVFPAAGLPELRVYDLGRGSWERVHIGVAFGSSWTADGKGILLTADVRGTHGVLLRVSADGAQSVDTLLPSSGPIRFATWDGRLVALTDSGGMRLVPVDSVQSSGWRVAAGNLSNFSPDGAWIATTDGQSGRSEVYVLSSSPNQTARTRISVDGGEEPRWSTDGRKIIFRFGARFYASDFTPGSTPRVGAPRLLFSGPYENVGGYSHDLFPDGRHLVLRQPGERTARQLVVVTNSEAVVRRTMDRP